jgi:hypothetical protein
VLVNPADVDFTDTSRLSREALVLRHEFAHVALADEVGPARPTWLTEGTAEWVSYAPYPASSGHALAQRSAALGTADAPVIPTDSDFTTGIQTTLDDAYLDAWLVCQDIVDHGGEARLLSLYAAASALPASDAGDPAALDTVLQAQLGLTAAQLQQRYLGDLERAHG